MNKKKILVFIDWYLPGYKAGGPIQSVANLVAHLNDEFDFFIVTRDTDYCEVKSYTSIVSNSWNKIDNGVSVYYFSKEALSFKKIKAIIQAQKFDYVYLNGIFSLYFTILPLIYLNKKSKASIIVASRGMFAESALNVKKTKKQLYIKIVKAFKLFSRVVFHATNEQEKQHIIAALGEKVKIRIAANLSAKENCNLILPFREKNKEKVRFVSIARIAPEKNLLFALQILKHVSGEVEFDFYGPIYNQEYWTACKIAMDELPLNVKANYKGSLPSDEVLTKLNDYHFLFMPTQGENFGHIILQSLSSGCPVLISDQTPWKQLKEKKAGWDVSLNNWNDFVNVINACVGIDQITYNEMSQASYDYAKSYISNHQLIEQNRSLFTNV